MLVFAYPIKTTNSLFLSTSSIGQYNQQKRFTMKVHDYSFFYFLLLTYVTLYSARLKKVKH